MKTALLFITVIFLSTFSSGVGAQTRIKTPAPAIVPTEKLSDYGRSQRTLADYSDCLVRLNRPRVMKFLEMYIEAKDSGLFGSRLAVPECLLSGHLRMTPRLLRGNLFGALYRMNFKEADDLHSFSYPVDYSMDIPAGMDITSDKDAIAYLAYRNFADCVVQLTPKEIKNIVRFEADSKKENAAWDIVVPNLSNCIIDGLEIKFTKSTLLSLFSESLFRLSRASQEASENKLLSESKGR